MNKLQLINPVRRQFEVISQFFIRIVGLPSVHTLYITHASSSFLWIFNALSNKEFESGSFVGFKASKLLKLYDTWTRLEP